ncbi:cryptochrome/photolyase family protein [Naasia lichenicola]|uniref:Deoxyribodipyrimidine photo-lyase n=1 Tax=Naasia lichenicola TaxID=2565933 RepID=A0A4S4FNK3_9MICO|nr:deoxyribodipyrimidine photo-lyase [Naasia lichenicola]THG31075.1 deoxyribodipyrimidine photo-lyase [Naasia lichenicola]
MAASAAPDPQAHVPSATEKHAPDQTARSRPTDTHGRPSIVWLRDDLRLADNPALRAAVDEGNPIVVLFVLDDSPLVARPRGGASRWWLHHSLTALAERIEERGARLILRRGDAAEEVQRLADEVDAGGVFWNRRYAEGERSQDGAVKKALRAAGRVAESFQGTLMYEPWTIARDDGQPYGVYSAFWRACAKAGTPREPVAEPQSLDGLEKRLHSDELASWELLPTKPDWATGLAEEWTPGERGAHERLRDFVGDRISRYSGQRDRPGAEASSRLSPHLRFGELSPFQVRTAVLDSREGAAENRSKFQAELGWREFNYSLLFHNPNLDSQNMRRNFDGFPWHPASSEVLERWQQGRTGIPLVDAGMRQLWTSGWMHNRVRMVVASFLIKNLLIDWREGEQWFWDTLVDADPANNAANWQWVAGSGVDSAPFFRVFNPVLQSQKFDPQGDYIRAWVPELADVPAKEIHEPRASGGLDLSEVGDYPEPMVDLKATRAEALDAFAEIKSH